MARIVPYNEVDFFETKERLLNFLKNQDRFKGYDFEGSNLSVLVDLLAYNSYNQLQYYNMSIGEMFLDSAQLRNSAVSHAKELNYLPRSRRSATALVNLIITAIQGSNSFIIPKGTSFIGRCGNISYEFTTDQTYIAERTNGNNFYVEGIKIYEGRLITEVLTTENTVISNAAVDTRSIRVFVNGKEFRYATTIFGVQPNDDVFYLQPELNGKYSIQFGEDVFGYEPTAGDELVVQYRITVGKAANGVASFITDAGALGARNINVLAQGMSVGGADIESLENIKKFAPKAFQVQERAVTSKDYEILLRQRFPEIQSISVFGGDEAEPPQYGRVIIAVDVEGRDGVSESEMELYKTYIKDKSPLTIEPVFQPAAFMYAKLNVAVKYDRNDALFSAAQLEALIRERIASFSDDTLDDFDVGLITSALQANLLQATASIDSVSITTNPIIDWSPPLQQRISPTFKFGSSFVKPYPYQPNVGIVDFKPAFESSGFTLQGTPVIMQDDGNGFVQALIANVNDRTVFKTNIGTVDYNRGIIVLKDLTVEEYVGNQIKLTVNTVDQDIFPPKDRIIRVRQEDVTVSIRPTK